MYFFDEEYQFDCNEFSVNLLNRLDKVLREPGMEMETFKNDLSAYENNYVGFEDQIYGAKD